MCAVRGERESVLGEPVLRDLASPRTKRTGSMFNGFIAVRRGLLEHLRRGKLTETEALTFIIILGLANPYTGIWFGSAKSLWGEYPFYGNERRARRALEGLASKWYIKRLSTPGKHSNYPILIDKYEVKVGEKVGLRLNARKSKNERSLCYEKIGSRQGEGELGVMPVGEQVVKVGVFGGGQTPEKAASNPPLLKKEKENEKKKRKNTAQASPSLELSVGWFDTFWDFYPVKVGKPAARRAWKKVWEKDFKTKLDADRLRIYAKISDGIERWKATEQWQKEDGKFIPYPATFLNQRRWEDETPNSIIISGDTATVRRTIRKPGKCKGCGAEIPAGFLKCLKCIKEKAPVNP